MNLQQMDAVRTRIATIFDGWNQSTTLDDMRNGFAELVSAGRTTDLTPADANGVPAAWFGQGDGVLFYCHGGGYQMGSIASHGPLMADLASASGCRVLGFDYRLAPEHRYPAALEDSIHAYRWLLDQGVTADRIAIAGDSAGAGLALATMLKSKQHDLPLPATAVFLSPWVDMLARSDTYQTRAERDPLTQRDKVMAMVKTYLGKDGDASDPFASPIEGDLSGLPPILVHVGGDETVLGDARLLSERAQAVGTEVETVVWDNMIHHFQVFPELDEARQSLAAIGDYLRNKIG
ncbi:alpha/beta hydrolase [Rhodobacteraceae bacterium D3-12]|nr:alpha/beta hydrolase [Rhodobacteraceae bacterium D3-12]